MTIDILFSFIITLLVGALIYQNYQFAKERKDFVRALLSRNVDDLNKAEMVDKVGKVKEQPDPEEEFIPITAETPDAFDKMIANANKS